MTRSRLVLVLWVLDIVATVAAAGAGLLFPDGYRDVVAGADVFSRAYWKGNDLVTLGLAVPLSVTAAYRAVHGSWRAGVVWLGTTYYLCYMYTFYVYGGTLSWFFPLHLGILMLSVAVLALAALDRGIPVLAAVSGRPTATAPVGGRARAWAGGYMMLFGAVTTTLWATKWAGAVADGDPAPASDEGEFIRTVAALDLPLLAAAMVLGAVLLWRGVTGARAAAAVVTIGATGCMIVQAAAAVANADAGVAGATGELGTWTLLAAGCLATSVALLAGPVRPPRPVPSA